MSASGYDVTEKELAFIKSVVASFGVSRRKSKCWTSSKAGGGWSSEPDSSEAN